MNIILITIKIIRNEGMDNEDEHSSPEGHGLVPSEECDPSMIIERMTFSTTLLGKSTVNFEIV